MVYGLQLIGNKNPANTVSGSINSLLTHNVQSYQFFRTYDNGWTVSVVSRAGMNGADIGLFEMAVWNASDPEFQQIVIATTQADFKEIAELLEEFLDDPERFYKESEGERGGNV